MRPRITHARSSFAKPLSWVLMGALVSLMSLTFVAMFMTSWLPGLAGNPRS